MKPPLRPVRTRGGGPQAAAGALAYRLTITTQAFAMSSSAQACSGPPRINSQGLMDIVPPLTNTSPSLKYTMKCYKSPCFRDMVRIPNSYWQEGPLYRICIDGFGIERKQIGNRPQDPLEIFAWWGGILYCKCDLVG